MKETNVYAIVAGLVALVLAYIGSLRLKNQKLKDKVGELEYNNTLKEDLSKKEEAEDEAISKEVEYARVRDEYKREFGDSSDK